MGHHGTAPYHFAAALVVVAVFASTAEAQVELRFSGPTIGRQFIQQALADVGAATGQLAEDIRIEVEKSGRFTSDGATLEALNKGDIDGAVVSIGVLTKFPKDDLAHDEIPGLALGYDASLRLDRDMRSTISDRISSRYEILLTIPGSPYGLYTRQQIKRLGDLKGQAFAALDGKTARFAKYFGAEVISSDGTTFLQAIKEKADAYLASSGYLQKPHNDNYRVKYFYPIHAFLPVKAVVVDKRLIANKLSTKQHEALSLASASAERTIWQKLRERTKQRIDSLESAGIEVLDTTVELGLDIGRLGGTILRQGNSQLLDAISEFGYGDPVSTGCKRVVIFFGTNREPSGGGQFGFMPDNLSLGRMDLGIPWYDTKHPLDQTLRCNRPAVQDITILRREVLKTNDFVAQLKYAFHPAGKSDPEALPAILVHGFGNSYDAAMTLAAGFVHDMNPLAKYGIAFSWPSEGTVTAYRDDEKRVASAPPHLASFVELVDDILGDGFALVAHSMGSRALAGALAELGKRNRLSHKPLVSFIAADIDEGALRGAVDPLAGSLHENSPHYMADNDLALQASKIVHLGKRRAGLISGRPFTNSVFDPIDVSNLNRSLIGHAYLRVDPAVWNDIANVIRTKRPASLRGMKPFKKNGVEVYRLKK